MNFFLFSSVSRYIKWKFIFKKLKQTKLFIGSDGEILKRFNVKDGLGIKLLQGAGIEIVFMSGGIGGFQEERAKQLRIKNCLVGVKDKYRDLMNLQQKMKVIKSNTIYVGDDINDLVVKPLIDLLFAPSNASKSLLKKVDMELCGS